jgi:hypothetical protein
MHVPYVCMYWYECMYRMYVCTYICMYSCLYINVCIHVCMYVCRHHQCHVGHWSHFVGCHAIPVSCFLVSLAVVDATFRCNWILSCETHRAHGRCVYVCVCLCVCMCMWLGSHAFCVRYAFVLPLPVFYYMPVP